MKYIPEWGQKSTNWNQLRLIKLLELAESPLQSYYYNCSSDVQKLSRHRRYKKNSNKTHRGENNNIWDEKYTVYNWQWTR